MQDRFKFRFWNTIHKRYENEYCLSTNGMTLDYIIPEQCTGLKDKNGNLIYEGDIISRKGMYRRVFWLDDEGGFGYEPATLFESLQTKTCKIVGNIHENPELLKENADVQMDD